MSIPTLELADPRHFIGRQLSWLAFNQRVLELAADDSLPLLERLQYLAISGENLDGFFMKRVGALQREAEMGVPRSEPSPLSAAAELAAVIDEVRALQTQQLRVLTEDLAPALDAAGIRLLDYQELDAAQRQFVERFFNDELYPILTPLAVDPARPFPFISNLSLSLAVVLHFDEGAPLFARVKVPSNRPRWIQLPGEDWFLPTEQAIAHHLDRLFRRMTVVGTHAFRVTRSADVARDDAAADDLLDFAAEMVKERRFAPVVRLELDAATPDEPRQLLVHELGLNEQHVFESDGLLGLADLKALTALDHPALRRPAWRPQPHPAFPPGAPSDAVFAAIQQRDVLVHHPYHDYDQTVVAFMAAAAADPQVLAIKQSLYRTTAQSPTLEALLRGAEDGKEVTALLELKARLDEAANVSWAQRLEQSGIHTSFGFVGFKTHTRMTLVVRQEADGLRRYVHLGTGDYNDLTARHYTDLGLFTCAGAICDDVTEFFNFLTGYADVPAYRKLVVAPTDMRRRLIECIDREIDQHAAGRPAHIVAMMNALADVPLSTALYRASQAGVEVELIVRGECCLRPGLPGVSERIRVRSVLGPFLEHARIFHFANGGDDQVYLGSADWMYRNLDHRVEVMLPIDDPDCRAELIGVLQVLLSDTVAAWELGPDADWRRVVATGPQVCAQTVLMERARAAAVGLCDAD